MAECRNCFEVIGHRECADNSKGSVHEYNAVGGDCVPLNNGTLISSSHSTGTSVNWQGFELACESSCDGDLSDEQNLTLATPTCQAILYQWFDSIFFSCALYKLVGID
jgi:hypothetical protein